MSKQRQTSDTCHCGSPMRGSDHCPHCGCEEWESTCDEDYSQRDKSQDW